jgi:uncharacterized membrane protein YdjX (TVP38/TMEM64 family)
VSPVTKRKIWLKWLPLGLALVAVVLVLNEFVEWRAVRDWMQHLDPWLLLVLMAVLPLFGFSISLVYLVIGAVFGGPMGVVVVAGISAVHLLGSHWIGRGLLRERLVRWLERRKHHLPALPAGENASLSLMTALVPWLPYFVRNYLLAISDIPLRTYFWVCWPIYVARSCLVIFLGDFSADLDARRITILGGVFVLKVGICAYVLQRLRARLGPGKRDVAFGGGARAPLRAEHTAPRSRR